MSVQEITNFVDGGGNVLVAASSNIGEALRELATENGFEFDESGTAVIDHFNYDVELDDGHHTTIVASTTNDKAMIDAPMIVGDRSKIGPILFKGIALVSDKTNNLRLEILSAATTAYSFNVDAKIEEASLYSIVFYYWNCQLEVI